MHYWSQDYENSGLHIVINDPTDTLAVLKAYLENPTVGPVAPLDRFHVYYDGRPYPTYWNDYGIGRYVPFGDLIDRDGYVRLWHTGSLDGNVEWETTIKQLCGVS